MNMPDTRTQVPRSASYPAEPIEAGGFGSHPPWMVEWLSQCLDLQPGMRVLDLGCWRARSSVFLAREFGVQVWATDLCCIESETVSRKPCSPLCCVRR